MAMLWGFVTGAALSPTPQWTRSAAIDDDGTVYVPAAMSDRDEMDVMLRATWDGIALVYRQSHLYVPSSWLAREFPDVADICEVVEAKMRAYLAPP